MYLFVYEGYKGGHGRSQRTDELILRGLEMYMASEGLDLAEMSREICRTEKGKPYFKELPVEFSVSHTDDLWVCLMDGEGPVGVDIQRVKETRQEKVAQRYFTADEQEYFKARGDDSFFILWTRKEAYAKYTGRGLNGELSQISTLDNKEVYFMDFDIREGVKGSCCVKVKGELCIKQI